MATPIKQLASTMQGHLLLLRVDGTPFWRQPSNEWTEVDTAGVPDRVVEVVSQPSGFPGSLILAGGAMMHYAHERRRKALRERNCSSLGRPIATAWRGSPATIALHRPHHPRRRPTPRLRW